MLCCRQALKMTLSLEESPVAGAWNTYETAGMAQQSTAPLCASCLKAALLRQLSDVQADGCPGSTPARDTGSETQTASSRLEQVIRWWDALQLAICMDRLQGRQQMQSIRNRGSPCGLLWDGVQGLH